MNPRHTLPELRAILDAFRDLGARCAFDLTSGRHCEGYLLTIEEDHAVFGGGGPLAPEENELIPLEQFDLASMSYWDEARRRWIEPRWDDARRRWMSDGS
jgi:hypothetical protein